MSKDLLYLLRVFCAVVEAGSLSAAAVNVGVQPPAVSKALARLEKLLGQRLLNRSTRTIEPTDAGQYLYAEGVKQLNELDGMLDTVRSQHHSLTGTLTVTATPAIGDRYITPHLAAFCKQHPQLEVDLLYTNDMIRLPSQRIDVAIRSSQSLEDSTLTSRKLFDVDRVVVASPAYLAQAGTPVKPQDIAEHDCLNFKHRGTYDTWTYFQGNARHELTTRTFIACNSYATLKALCLNGMGLGRLFRYQVDDELQRGELVQVLPRLDWGRQSVHAVYHGRKADSPGKVHAFITHVAAAAIRGQ